MEGLEPPSIDIGDATAIMDRHALRELRRLYFEPRTQNGQSPHVQTPGGQPQLSTGNTSEQQSQASRQATSQYFPVTLVTPQQTLLTSYHDPPQFTFNDDWGHLPVQESHSDFILEYSLQGQADLETRQRQAIVPSQDAGPFQDVQPLQDSLQLAFPFDDNSGYLPVQESYSNSIQESPVQGQADLGTHQRQAIAPPQDELPFQDALSFQDVQPLQCSLQPEFPFDDNSGYIPFQESHNDIIPESSVQEQSELGTQQTQAIATPQDELPFQDALSFQDAEDVQDAEDFLDAEYLQEGR
ncbi:hypothetical protein CGRA01v4_02886 [Colletotrichum graminicola]|nr:hypothetical protein CGRA01v4_02886 [Colletotrichum graminicola]